MKLRSPLRAAGASPISLFAFQDIIFAATGIFLFVAIMMTLFGKIDLIATEALDEGQPLRAELRSLAERMTIAEQQVKVIQSGPEAADINPQDIESRMRRQSDRTATENPWLYDLQELLQHNKGLRKRTDELYQNLTALIMEMNRRELRLELLQSGAYQALQTDDLAIVREGPAHDFREPIFLSLDSAGYTITYPGRSELNQEFATQEKLREQIESTFKPETQSFLIHVKPSGIGYFQGTKDMLQELGYRIGYEPVLEDFKF